MTSTPGGGPRSGWGQGERRARGDAVLVTGAAGGIGAAVVEHLAGEGWSVLAADVVAPQAAECGAGVRYLAFDVTDAGAVAAAAAGLRAQGVSLAGLVTVAGVLQDVAPLLEPDPEAERRVWEVDYFGVLHCVRAFAPMMIDGSGGSIVTITSINAHRPLPLHAYAPAKAALATATALAAGELGRFGIRVNAVAPGFTRTPALERKLVAGTRDAAAITAHSALGRLVGTDEVASVVGFLLDDAAAAITGASIPVDAGWLAASHWMDMGAQLHRREAGA